MDDEKKTSLLEEGDKVGDYTVVKLLGKGAMGAVYLARVSEGARYAVKVMDPDAAQKNPDFRKRFLREGEFAIKIRHPNLIPVHRVGEDPETGLCYLVMDYLPGGSLADRLNSRKRLPLEEAVAIVAQIADALEVAHRHGVIHRDIKPDNIMFDADGIPKLADLGVAKFTDGDSKTTVTTTGMIIGTPAYMAPEQMMDSRHIDARADVYALGVVLYEMLAGRRPYEGSTAVELLAKAIKGEPLPDVRTLRPEVSAALSYALSLMCAPKPEGRPSTPHAAVELIRRAENGTLNVPKNAFVHNAGRRRWWKPVLLAAVGVIVIGATFRLATWDWGRRRKDAVESPSSPRPADLRTDIDRPAWSTDLEPQDIRRVADTMAESLLSDGHVLDYTKGTHPVLDIAPMKNKSQVRVDLEGFMESVRERLVRSRLFRFVDRSTAATDAAIIERDARLGRSGTIRPGSQVAAQMYLTGTLTGSVTRAGKSTEHYYKFSMILKDLRTGEIVWADEKEICKRSSGASNWWDKIKPAVQPKPAAAPRQKPAMTPRQKPAVVPRQKPEDALQAFKARLVAANPGLDVAKIEEDVTRRTKRTPPPARPPGNVQVMAIFVKNQTKTSEMDDYIGGIRDRLAAELSGLDFIIMDNAEINAAFNRFKVDTAAERAGLIAGLFTGGSVTRVARMLGADYILTASVIGASQMRRAAGDSPVTIYTLRMSTRVLDATTGGSVYGRNWSQRSNPQQENGTNAMRHYENLLDTWVQETATDLAATRPRWREPATRAGTLVPFTVTTTLDDIFKSLETTVDASKQGKDELRVVAGGIAVSVDGAILDSSGGSFQARPGLHQLRVSRQWMVPWTGTVNVQSGAVFNVALELSDEGFRHYGNEEGLRAELALAYAEAASRRGCRIDFNHASWRSFCPRDTKSGLSGTQGP